MISSRNSDRLRGGASSKMPADMWSLGATRLDRQLHWKRFDGAAKRCSDWDHLRKDPELWLPGNGSGSCFVHLYEKGQSQKGPAFKILFASLLSAQCQPLIERFVDRAVSEEEAYQNGRVDLYIPAPRALSRSQAAQYHLAIRNLFAWVSRRSVVGDHLGNALVGLAKAMDDFREPEAPNTKDLLDYLDEEGYLDMRNQPDYALGILHLAEVLQTRDLYMDAFAHCVGMSEQLHKHAEYSRVSIASRKLIHRARVDMDFRLSRAGAMLGDLLDEELSEAHLGLSAGARAHLDRFRSYVQHFYAIKFGIFPPPAADSHKCGTVFRPDVYRCMKADLEALYHYLVDKTFTTTDNAPSVAQGGLCVLQSVHEFDLRHRFPPLDHPLPLLPAPMNPKEIRRRRSMPLWFMGSGRSREEKLRSDRRLETLAALLQATNHSDFHLLDNDLVRAYRDFEEDYIVTQQCRGSNDLAVTPGDARKVRWLFIYAMYQTLRSCADTPREVRCMGGVGYHLGVFTNIMAPWQKTQGRLRPPLSHHGQETGSLRPSLVARGRSIGAAPLLSPWASLSPKDCEITPDIDYFALTHPEAPEVPPHARAPYGFSRMGRPQSRSQSLTRSMSLRRSLSVFRHSAAAQRCGVSSSSCSARAAGRTSMYQEIIVQGYGNGTIRVDLSAEGSKEGSSGPPLPPPLTVTTTCLTASRSASTSSTNSSSSTVLSATASSLATHSLASTTPTSPGSPTSSRQTSKSWESAPALVPPTDDTQAAVVVHTEVRNKKVDYHCAPLTRTPSPHADAHDEELLPSDVSPLPPPLPRRSSKRRSSKRHMATRGTPPLPKVSKEGAVGTGTVTKRWSMVDVSASLREVDSDCASETDNEELQPSPLRIRKPQDAGELFLAADKEWERNGRLSCD